MGVHSLPQMCKRLHPSVRDLWKLWEEIERKHWLWISNSITLPLPCCVLCPLYCFTTCTTFNTYTTVFYLGLSWHLIIQHAVKDRSFNRCCLTELCRNIPKVVLTFCFLFSTWLQNLGHFMKSQSNIARTKNSKKYGVLKYLEIF